jgi:RNA polymerase sigma-70 factor, ECF subfamily
MGQAVTEDDIRRIYDATIDALYRYVSSRCGGERDLAEDITQETWLRAVRTWHAKGLPDEPAAWLTTVARNLLVSHYRRRPAERLDDATAASLAADAADEGEERRSLVTRALARLPLPAVRLLHAFHFQERRVADIAVEHGVTERAVEGRLRRAREQLRHQVALDSETDSEGDPK